MPHCKRATCFVYMTLPSDQDFLPSSAASMDVPYTYPSMEATEM